MAEIKSPTDFILVNAACKGDNSAFAELIRRYQKKVHALGISFFKNTADTEDFVQEVWIKVYTKLSLFRREAQFSTWLMRIAYNTAVNSVNRRKEYLPLNEDFDIADNALGPEERQLRKITMQAVQQSMKGIPAHFAICLDMYFFYGMAYNDISEVLDIPVNTIKSHIFRAKKLMKQKLENII